MVKSKLIRVHPIFFDALEQMKRDLERLEEEMFPNTELTRRLGLRMRRRRKRFARSNKWIEE